MRFIDRSGEKYGYLTVKCLSHKNNGRAFWFCICRCGKTVIVPSGNLSGNTTSCGCKKVEACLARATHGMSKSPEYKLWKNMRERCLNANCEMFKHYGGRGITICKRWQKFENFLDDMGPYPGKGFSVERKKVNQGYKPSNCVWLHRTRQNRNRRDTIRIKHVGKILTLVEWSEVKKIPLHTLKARRVRGWSVKRMLETPPRFCAKSR